MFGKYIKLSIIMNEYRDRKLKHAFMNTNVFPLALSFLEIMLCYTTYYVQTNKQRV